MLDTIITSFDIWTDAQGVKSKGRVKSIENISLEGIVRLRDLILELAMRGKLVPQCPNDEPSSELLKRINAEKSRLVKEGVIKKTEDISEVKNNEKFYDIPKGWEWTRLKNIGHDWGQQTPTKTFTYIDVSSIDNEKGKVASTSVLEANKAPSRARKIVKKGSIIYATVRPYLKNICVIDHQYIPEPIASTAFAILHPYLEMPGTFFYLYLRSPAFIRYVESVQNGIAYPAINDKQFFHGLVPLPPLEEQKRIVAKVEALIALCDQLEAQKTNNLKTHQQLVKTLLETLTHARDADEVQKAWQQLMPHFDTLFCTEDSIDQLKQTILQLAIMGRLVKQDPKDEPAKELIKRIEKEKEKLVKEGKIKKEKALPDISKEEKPFALPQNWEWVRLGNITNKIGSGSTPRGGNNAYVNSGVIFLRSQNIRNEGLLLDDTAYISKETNEKMTNTIVLPNDILLNITGGSLGRSTIFPSNIKMANISQHVTIIRPTITDSSRFLHMCILSPYIQSLIWGRQVGANREGLSKKVLEQFEFPYPPLVEQDRITAKIKELFALCDQLKNKIIQTQEIQNTLSKTIVENAIA